MKRCTNPPPAHRPSHPPTPPSRAQGGLVRRPSGGAAAPVDHQAGAGPLPHQAAHLLSTPGHYQVPILVSKYSLRLDLLGGTRGTRGEGGGKGSLRVVKGEVARGIMRRKSDIRKSDNPAPDPLSFSLCFSCPPHPTVTSFSCLPTHRIYQSPSAPSPPCLP